MFLALFCFHYQHSADIVVPKCIGCKMGGGVQACARARTRAREICAVEYAETHIINEFWEFWMIGWISVKFGMG